MDFNELDYKEFELLVGLLLKRKGFDILVNPVSDEDLIEMIQLREGENESFDVIDAQLEDFLRRLTP
ncbi:MAG: hypothetical protein KDI79_19570 [Anaerolineae bacterium]|nr:hypothetical protein [Anaerolineae bacterium]